MRHSSCHTQGYLGKATLGAHGHHRTLRRARESVYWPNMNANIKNYIERCEICSENRTTAQQRETLIPHERSSQPWAKVGIDMFSLDKRSFLINVDYWSNFFELDQILGETNNISFLGMVSLIQLSLTMVPSFLQTHSHSSAANACFAISLRARIMHNQVARSRAL